MIEFSSPRCLLLLWSQFQTPQIRPQTRLLPFPHTLDGASPSLCCNMKKNAAPVVDFSLVFPFFMTFPPSSNEASRFLTLSESVPVSVEQCVLSILGGKCDECKHISHTGVVRRLPRYSCMWDGGAPGTAECLLSRRA